jgi:proline racemase
MCGHATIALGRWAVEERLVDVPAAGSDGVARAPVRLQAPCGLVEVEVEVTDGRVGDVRFRSVPAFAAALDVDLEVEGVGDVRVDVGYGGAFYALVDAAALDVELGATPLADVVARATAVSRAAAGVTLAHPDAADLSFLYGTIVRDVPDDRAPEVSRNVCVFADRQVDRSPTGSGVTARTAVRHARGAVATGEVRRFSSLTGAEFTAAVVAEHAPGSHTPDGVPAVTVEVGGRAHRTGTAEFVLEDDDPLRGGFLLR